MTKKTLANGDPVTADHRDIDPTTGMQKAYVVLSAEERAKGFTNPVRMTYVHVGPVGPANLRDLPEEEKEQYAKYNYVKFEEYGFEKAPVFGRFWTQERLDQLTRGCNKPTTMGLAIAETYAKQPNFYSSTFCAHCGTHFPVGKTGEFVWEGSDDRVGV